MNQLKRLLSVFLVLVMALGVLPVRTFAATVEGTCGENVTWKLTSDGTLTISGSGPMEDFIFSGQMWPERESPFRDYISEIKKIVIKSGVTTIGDNAFCYLSNVKSVQIPNGVTSIGQSAFYETTSLTSVTLPSSLTTIEQSAFKKSGLTKIKIPESVTQIGGSAFYFCVSLKSVQLPSGITEIPSRTFFCCEALQEITIPEGVTSIGRDAFHGCGLTKVQLPESLVFIGPSAFNWSGLKQITIPKNVTRIETDAFGDCFSLETIRFTGHAPQQRVLFSSVTATAYYPAAKTWTEEARAAYGGDITWVEYQPETPLNPIVAQGTCGAAVTWALSEDGVLTISGEGQMENFVQEAPWRVYAPWIHTVIIENGVTSVGREAFKLCSQIRKVELPDTIEHIYSNSFYQCTSLQEIVIPGNVLLIEAHAFRDCTNLTDINFLGSAPDLRDNCFMDVTAVARYPAGDATWESAIAQKHGGKITWVAECRTTHIYQAVVTAPTCTEEGYTTHTCTNCGDTYTDTPVAATGHNFTEWAEVDGITSRTCQNEGCGLVEYESCAKNLTTGKLYSDLSVALGEAVSGDTVVLLSDMDATAAPLLVFSGVTLDLGGYSLRVNYLIGLKGSLVTGDVVDKNGENGAKLIVPQNGIVLPELAPDGAAEGYKIIPVWNGDHYIFSQAVISNQSFTVTGDTAKVQFLPNFSGYVKNSLFKPDGCEDNDVSVIISVSWMESGIWVTQEYFYTTSLIIDAMNNKGLYAVMTGCDTKEDLVFRIAIVTGSGAQVVSQEYVYAEQ